MDPNPAKLPDKPLIASDIQSVMEQHGQVLRISYMEIASGINRLLRQGIPKEVIAQVLNQTVEALAKESPRTPRTRSNQPARP
ncbi:MAG: hypothetical protein QOG55_618 [Acidobacteriaceae bacterium]|jgi:hypothetical protein|nr:hypothetical protein [Acidobacteriaceae bacterium]